MTSPTPIYSATQFPVFQNRMYDSVASAIECPKGDIMLAEDAETGVVCNTSFRPELMVYDEHYQNEQAVSQRFRDHLSEVAVLVEDVLGRTNLVEVGCGKGHFLELLWARGNQATGFDPTYEGDNPGVQKRLFTGDIGITAKGLILRHVLEHIQGPVDFLRELKIANQGGGLIYIEVPCFDWIRDHRAWFDIFYEHVNYFRLSDFDRMFGKVIRSGRCFGGQYLYVIADLASLRATPLPVSVPVAMPADMLQTMHAIAKRDDVSNAVVWGGASKGVIFALMMSRLGVSIRDIIDINPAKQGKYVAATGVRVKSPQEALSTLPRGSTIYIMNSNYSNEIKAMAGLKYNYIGIDNE
jgi:SAM-dependent methyltransferase